MNLCIFISGVTGGGAEKVTCAIASFLASKGHKIELITMSDEDATYPLDNRVSRICLLREREQRNFIYNNSLRFFRFAKYLIKQKPDAYLAMLPTNIMSILSLSFLTSAKIIAAERANPDSYKKEVQKILKFQAKEADGWVFQTYEQMAWYESKSMIKKGIVIPNAINTDVLHVRATEVREKKIVSVGRLTDQKNHLLLVEAFSRIAGKHKDYSLVIYGEGPNRSKIEERISSLCLNERIKLPGYSSNVINSIKNASLFVLSSNYEGMPNALMEAMAIGVPSISTDCGGGGANFLIENEKNGILVPIKDVDALANAMDRVLSNQEFAESLGRESRKLCETLAPDIIYGRWGKFIEEIVSSK